MTTIMVKVAMPLLTQSTDLTDFMTKAQLLVLLTSFTINENRLIITIMPKMIV